MYLSQQESSSPMDYNANLNSHFHPRERLTDEHLLPRFLLGLKSKRLHDLWRTTNPPIFELWSKTIIKLSGNMMGKITEIPTSPSSISGSQDSRAFTIKYHKDALQSSKDLSAYELDE